MNNPGFKDILGFEMLRCGIDIFGMTKTHLTGSDDEETASTGHSMIDKAKPSVKAAVLACS